MNKIVSLASAIALTGITALSSIVPVQAQNVTFSVGERYRVIETYCDRNPWDRDCYDFYQGGWNDRDYYRFYNSPRRSSIDSIATGVLGFTFGAALGSIIANGNNNRRGGDVVVGRASGYDAHVQACYSRYRSYDERSDTFMGYDGIRKRCRL